MSSLQNALLFLAILCLFTTRVLNEPILPGNRERGDTSNGAAATTNSTSNNYTSLLVSNPTAVSSAQNIISEGSSASTTQTHVRKEHVLEPPQTKNGTDNVMNNNDSTAILAKSEVVKPVYDVPSPPQYEHINVKSNSVPKKGVSLPEPEPQQVPNTINLTISNDATSNHSNSVNKSISAKVLNKNGTVIIRKPKVTEPDDYVDTIKSKENTITVDQIDPLLVDKKINRSDYIVPIVAIILSVPLVAILISTVYKRGADWWQHRNYKRMDFLIEGMYHN